MNRARHFLAVVLLAGIALAGCSPSPAPSSTTTQAAAATTGVRVATVELGNAVGADGRVLAPATSFAMHDTIHASVATTGSGGTLTATWTFQDGQNIDTQRKPVAPVQDFSISKIDGWPAGKYKVVIALDGNTVRSLDFEVK